MGFTAALIAKEYRPGQRHNPAGFKLEQKSSAKTVPSTEKKSRRNTQPSMQKYRTWVQTASTLVCIWIGVEFYFFVVFLETAGLKGSTYRPTSFLKTANQPHTTDDPQKLSVDENPTPPNSVLLKVIRKIPNQVFHGSPGTGGMRDPTRIH